MSAALRIQLMLLAQKNFAGNEAKSAGSIDIQHQPRGRRSVVTADIEQIETDIHAGENYDTSSDFSPPRAKSAADFRLSE